MKTGEVFQIRYEKATDLGSGNVGEVTERAIVPTNIPSENVKALDVTDLSANDREQMKNLYEEYQKYYKQQVSTIFNFEDWLTHTGHDRDVPNIKWRTFRKQNIEII